MSLETIAEEIEVSIGPFIVIASTKFYELLIGKFSFYIRLTALATDWCVPDFSNHFCMGRQYVYACVSAHS